MNTTTTTKQKIDVVPLTKHIGAEIRGIDLREQPDESTVKAIYQAWLDHLVVVFPGQKLSQEDLNRVTHYFGEQGMPRRPAKFFPKGYANILPGIMMISNIRENGEPIGALPDGEMMFHHDMIHSENPDKATLLYAVEIPSSGGNTLFASGYAAYDTLDPAVRNKLDGRIATHHYNYGSTIKGDRKGTEAFGTCDHPAFRTNEDTGRKAVYVNRLMTTGIVGMSEAEVRSAPECGLRSCGETGIRLRTRLAIGRSAALGQSLFVPRAHRLPVDRAPPHVPHHGQRLSAAVLSLLSSQRNDPRDKDEISCDPSRSPLYVVGVGAAGHRANWAWRARRRCRWRADRRVGRRWPRRRHRSFGGSRNRRAYCQPWPTQPWPLLLVSRPLLLSRPRRQMVPRIAPLLLSDRLMSTR